jgi:plasmid stabilization system protein ParE
MALKIFWTNDAKKGVAKVVEYLEANWTQREIINLENNIRNILLKIISNPELFAKSHRIKGAHKAIIDKNNYLLYKINLKKEQIQIVTFRSTKQRPKH